MYYPDISHWKPVKNWNEVKENCPFIISKATQGTNYIDPTLDSFIKGCEANGILYWLYTFLNRGNEKAQAEFMVKVCAPKVGKHFVGYVLDIESGNRLSLNANTRVRGSQGVYADVSCLGSAQLQTGHRSNSKRQENRQSNLYN